MTLYLILHLQIEVLKKRFSCFKAHGIALKSSFLWHKKLKIHILQVYSLYQVLSQFINSNLIIYIQIGMLMYIHNQCYHLRISIFTETQNTFVHVTVDVHQRYTIVNCFFFSKYNDLSCHMEYGKDCDNLTHKKKGAAVNGSDVSLLLFDILPSTEYCYVVTADNGTHLVKEYGSFQGEFCYGLNFWMVFQVHYA